MSDTAVERSPQGHALSDDVLVLRVARDDRPAFAELYRRYARPVYGLALERAVDHEHAERATRAVFEAVWREAAAFDPAGDEAREWLHRVARGGIDAHLARSPEAGRPDGPGTSAAHETRRWQAHRALAGLAADETSTVELLTWGGVTTADAARYLGIREETVASRARSGYLRLAAALELPGDEPGEADPGDDPLATLDAPSGARARAARTTLRDVGAPPELPPTLHEPADPGSSSGLGRRRFTIVATAITAAVAVFAVGYVVGGADTPEQAVSTSALSGAGEARGEVVVLARDAGGNWPVELTASGLPALAEGADYELRVRTQAGDEAVVGRFRAAPGLESTIRFSTPADVGRGATWSVVGADPAARVVLSTGS